ncbi:ribonuclease III [Oscillospiraceae bacterium CM]|nr:ribonuclease III [Oscillospiraceae bacterium CM]
MTDYLSIQLSDDALHQTSTLGLAQLGDAVYSLMIRSWLCLSGRATAHGLHKASVGFVAAPAQARAVAKIMPELTAAEAAVFKRGRNTRVRTIPRGATQEEYHAATGLEALFGYLYAKGETKRLNDLFARIVENGEGE